MGERQKWTSADWKEDLSTKAQQHLGQLEQQVEKLRKERDQKQCQLDSLEQVRNEEMCVAYRAVFCHPDWTCTVDRAVRTST